MTSIPFRLVSAFALAMALCTGAAAQNVKGPTLDELAKKGDALLQAGKFAEALVEYEKAYRVAGETLGAGHRDTAVMLANRGIAQYKLGKLLPAETDLAEAVRILALKPADANAAKVRGFLATVLMASNKNEEAEKQLIETLAALEKIHGPDHLELAHSLDLLGTVTLRLKKWEPAREHVERAIRIVEKRSSPTDLRIAGYLSQLHETYRDFKNDWRRREECLLREIRIREHHKDLIWAFSDPVAFREFERDFASGKTRDFSFSNNANKTMVACELAAQFAEYDDRRLEAAELIDKSRKLNRGIVAFLSAAMHVNEQLLTDKDAVTDAQGLRGVRLATAKPTDQRIVDLAAGWVINGKGMRVEVVAERIRQSRDDASGDPKKAGILKELGEIRSRLSSAELAANVTGDAAAKKEQIERLLARKTDLENKFAQVRIASGSLTWIDTTDVQRALPADSVYVDYVRVEGETPRYYAFVIPPAGKGAIRAFDLGNADTIDAVATAARDSVETSRREIGALGEVAAAAKLDRLLASAARRLIRPLMAELDAYPNWVICPDGDLWVLPWAALPMDAGGYLVEKRQVRQVVSGRELIRKATGGPTHLPVVLADPDYDLVPDGAAAARPATKWSRLPGTAAEAEAVAPNLQKWAGAAPKVFLQGQATEAAFKSFARPKALIFSTHGYFFGSEPAGAGTRGLSRDATDRIQAAPPPSPGTKPATGNPLLRCGLVLAGANRPPATGEDGVLTGLEIVGSDLRGTQIVVLSACETGLGQANPGQGVVGLRQAFHLAGAESVIASLWQVPDRETADLMKGFFGHLASGQPPSVALATAQREAIVARRATRGAAHPFYWAAFSVSGPNP